MAKESRARRRGTWALGGGILGALGTIAEQIFNASEVANGAGEMVMTSQTSEVHTIGLLAAGVITFGIEKVTDWLRERTGGKADYTDTGRQLAAALADLRLSRDEVKSVVDAAIDDTAEMFDGYEHDGLGEPNDEEPPPAKEAAA